MRQEHMEAVFWGGGGHVIFYPSVCALSLVATPFFVGFHL